MTLKENDDDSVSLLFALGMLLFDAVLYFFLTFYIIAVNPGKFGAAKSPFFIFQVSGGIFSTVSVVMVIKFWSTMLWVRRIF